MDFHACFRDHKPILLEGALGERLKREFGLVPDDDVAWAHLVYSERGREALAFLWRQYGDIAKAHRLPFAATTPTRRANADRAARSKYGRNMIHDNVAFLKDVRDSIDAGMFVGGLLGCRGDAYRGTEVLPADEAREFHAWQADLFASEGVDFLYAGIMPALPEAVGMAQAMGRTGIPYIISFMIRENGRLIDGTAIHDAIVRIDASVSNKPECYMTNCVHPTVLYRALSASFNRTDAVRERFCGIQANTSPLPPELLDGAAELECADCRELAGDMARLKDLMQLKIAGGCCGTDDTHLEHIARLLAG